MAAPFTIAPPPHRFLVVLSKAEIGKRIRELRENSAETNRSIADYVGIGERSVSTWIAGGGITYDHAKKVAELFGVDVGYILRGETEEVSGEAEPPGEALSSLRSQYAEVLGELSALRTEIRLVLSQLRPDERGRGGSDS